MKEQEGDDRAAFDLQACLNEGCEKTPKRKQIRTERGLLCKQPSFFESHNDYSATSSPSRTSTVMVEPALRSPRSMVLATSVSTLL